MLEEMGENFGGGKKSSGEEGKTAETLGRLLCRLGMEKKGMRMHRNKAVCCQRYMPLSQ